MTRVHDSLAGAVIKREELRQLSYCESISSSSISADFSTSSSFHSALEDVSSVGSVSEIFSPTRFAVISNGLNFAADSDTVWSTLLPSDCTEILSRSVSQVCYATKKELYLSLFHTPILLDAGKLSFSLEKMSGKKCYMVCARELGITWGDNRDYWKWTSHEDSRFSEVAQLQSVCWLDIRGKIEMQMLSSNSTYGAYLVFKLSKGSYGLGSANGVVRLVNYEADRDAENRAAVVHLQQESEKTGQLPVRRADGWMEIELGSFYNEEGDNGEVEARLIEILRLHWKCGLVVEGIEFRPKENSNWAESKIGLKDAILGRIMKMRVKRTE